MTDKQLICIVACTIAVCMDPFFLCIPFLSHTKKCLGMNTNLWKVTVALRSVADVAYIATSNRLSKELELNDSIKMILLAYASLLAFAPIPQILFSEKFILKTLRRYTFGNWSLFCHYGARLVLIFHSCEELNKRVSVTALRFNALVYLFLYIIVSHVIGASWYYLSIKRQVSCWHHACKLGTGCVDIFPCDGTTTSTLNSTLVNEFCPLNRDKFGIYLDVLQSSIVEEKGVLKKFLQCFFWGLRNISSFASNLQTSTNGGETFFAIIISIVALLLLIYIIGKIQRYAESASARSERIANKMKLIIPKIKLLGKSHNLGESREKLIVEHIQKALEKDKDIQSFNFKSLRIVKNRVFSESVVKHLDILETSILKPKKHIQGNAEKWLSDNNIPPHYQNNILFYLKCRLENDQDVNLKSVLSALPYEFEKHLCFDTIKKVPRLQNIDEEWFESMSSKLKPVIYPEESYIFREGEPLGFIIFITNGIAWSYTTSSNAGGRVSGSSKSLEKGDFFGEELVQWKLDKRRELELDRIPLSCIPFSTANVKSHTQVEALVLMTKDLALCSDFPVDSSRSADLAIERVDKSSRTEEGASVRREIEGVINIFTD